MCSLRHHTIRLTFGAMDVDQDRRVTPDEFKTFSMGFEYLARVRDKLPAFNAVKADTFKRWDTGTPGHLTPRGYAVGIKDDLDAAAGKNASGVPNSTSRTSKRFASSAR